MKKIIFVMLVSLVAASSTKAINPTDCKMFTTLKNASTFNGLTKYLQTDTEQNEKLKYIFEQTNKRMTEALNSEDFVATEKTVDFNLANVKYVLDPDQYKKYLTIINLSLYNKDEEILLTEK